MFRHHRSPDHTGHDYRSCRHKTAQALTDTGLRAGVITLGLLQHRDPFEPIVTPILGPGHESSVTFSLVKIPHDLRHKRTTVALTNGVSIHEVSRRLGHRSIKVTVDRSGHLTQDGQERCRQVVETAVGPHMLTPGRVPAVRGADLVLT
ncbi:site-specific integrase [Streptomyces gardneri]|uniref:hypothetical protein n=1 Tax=Streptomyces gardneri TaxID=66892 RepID=UPI0036ADB67E